jgi:hypothetical protein
MSVRFVSGRLIEVGRGFAYRALSLHRGLCPTRLSHPPNGAPMTLAVLKSRALTGMTAPEVTVEVHLANGLPAFTIAGNNIPEFP